MNDDKIIHVAEYLNDELTDLRNEFPWSFAFEAVFCDGNQEIHMGGIKLWSSANDDRKVINDDHKEELVNYVNRKLNLMGTFLVKIGYT